MIYPSLDSPFPQKLFYIHQLSTLYLLFTIMLRTEPDKTQSAYFSQVACVLTLRITSQRHKDASTGN